jgi:hypothetical protein
MSLYHEALELSRRVGTMWGVRNSVIGLARVADGQAQHERAARLLGAADALSMRAGISIGPTDRAHVARVVAGARQALGDGAFEAVWSGGRSLPLEMLIPYSLGLDHRSTAAN